MTKSLADTNTVFRAFADETRLRILHLLLAAGDLCVCDLCAVLGVLQPSVSRHLAYLDRAGLVSVRQEGKWKHYRIVKNSDALQRRLLNCVRGCLCDVDVLRDDLKCLAAQRKRGRCCLRARGGQIPRFARNDNRDRCLDRGSAGRKVRVLR